MTARWISKPALYALAIAFALFWIMPLWFTFINAFKTSTDFFQGEFWLLPKEFNLFQNVAAAWSQGQLGTGFLNSLVYGIAGSAIAIFLAALASYSMTVMRLKGSFWWFIVIYSGTMFPFQMYLIPLYKLYTWMGMYDTYGGMILFYTAVSIPFATLVLRNFFTTISDEIAEAARVDGCGHFRIFWSMYLPLSRSALAVLFLFQFTWIWNDLLFGLTLTNSPNVRPVMTSLDGLMGIYSSTSMPVLLAGCLVASAPTILLFTGLQRYFMQGLTLSAKTS